MRIGLTYLALLALGCAGGDDAVGDGDGDGDAGFQTCLEANEATIGRCVVDATGAACTSSNEDDQRFEAITEGSMVPMSLGFQGLNMFPMAIRTTAIDPGGQNDPELDPQVNARLAQGGAELTGYMNRVPFTDAGGGELETLHTFMVIQIGAEDLVGADLVMDVVVTDVNNEMRCGRLGFVGGQIE